MHHLISSYLIQAKECDLPGLGSFRIITIPAWLDVANKMMNPPVEAFEFSEKSGPLTDRLVNYIAHKKSVEKEEANALIRDWCNHTKESLKKGDTLYLKAIGTIHQDDSGNLHLRRTAEGSLLEAVPAIRVVHKDAAHNVLVGDSETTSDAIHQSHTDQEEIIPNGGWKIAAVVLLLIGIAVLAFHFYTGSGIANRTNFQTDTPADTYQAK